MTYTAQCDRCGESSDEPFLMGQFHEDEYLTTTTGDRLKEADFRLQDTVTFCESCTIALLLTDDR